MTFSFRLFLVLTITSFSFSFSLAPPAMGQYFNDIELSPHNYHTAEGKDPMSVLIKKAKNCSPT